MTNLHRLRAGAGILLALALLAGCGGSGEQPNAQDKPAVTVVEPENNGATTDPESEPAKKPKKVVKVKEAPGTSEGFVGARDDVDLATCEVVGKKMQIDGTVTNPTDAIQNYRIYVSILDADGTRGLLQVDAEAVEAGATQQWATEAKLSDTGLRCVLRVERYEAK